MWRIQNSPVFTRNDTEQGLQQYCSPPPAKRIINNNCNGKRKVELSLIFIVNHSLTLCLCVSLSLYATMTSLMFQINDCSLLGKALATFRWMRDIANVNFSSSGVSIIASHPLDSFIAVLKISPPGCENFHCPESGTIGVDIRYFRYRMKGFTTDPCSLWFYIFAKGNIAFFFIVQLFMVSTSHLQGWTQVISCVLAFPFCLFSYICSFFYIRISGDHNGLHLSISFCEGRGQSGPYAFVSRNLYDFLERFFEQVSWKDLQYQ